MKANTLCTQQVLDFLSAKHVSHAQSIDQTVFFELQSIAA